MSLSELHLLKIKTRVKYGDSSFQLNLVKLWETMNYEKVQSLVFSIFLLVLTKFLFYEEAWALGFNCKYF